MVEKQSGKYPKIKRLASEATVHVLPELTHPAARTHALLPTQEGARPHAALRPAEVLILTAGALLPLLLTMGHKH